MRHYFLILTSIAIGACLWGIATGQQLQSPGGMGTIVATVNMSSIFAKLQMVQDLEKTFSQENIKIQAEGEKRREQVLQLKKELDSGAFARGSSDFIEREDKIEKLMIEADFWTQKTKRLLQSAHKKWFEEVYKRVSAACQNIALQNGIDIVLTNNPIEFNVTTSEALIAQILQKKVVYAGSRVDLTSAVLAQTDNDYLKDGGASMINLAK